LSTGIYVVFLSKNAGEFVVKSWWIAGKCMVAIASKSDVHYLGLELSDFCEFSGWKQKCGTLEDASPD
jgi:hypothetical protein